MSAEREFARWVVSCLFGMSLLTVPLLAQPEVAGDRPQPGQADSAATQPRFDGVYAAKFDGEVNAQGQPRWIVVRFYEGGMSVEAEFHGDLSDCYGWLSRASESLYPGRWQMENDQLTVLESTGLFESERNGRLSAEGWTTTPTVTVRDTNGWKLEPAVRASGPPLVLEFRPVKFVEDREQAAGNRRPAFHGFGSHNRLYDYNRAGSLVGISEELTVQAVDPDQDPLTFTWTVSNGSVTGEGPKAIWERTLVNGRPEPGTIGVEVTDGRGGQLAFTWDSEVPPAGGWISYPSGGR
jgi:hypothetical protein